MAGNGGIYYCSSGEGYGFAEALLPTEEATGALVWHPIIPIGKFDHPDYGTFEVKYDNLSGIEANFRAGLPGPKGIPIDEDGRHRVRGEGAFGWIKDVQIRDGALWGGIEWTEDGLAAVASGKLPYISAHFFLGGDSNNMYGRDNLIFACALCSRPFFYDQPELRIAASDYRRVLDLESADDEGATAAAVTDAAADTEDADTAAAAPAVAGGPQSSETEVQATMADEKTVEQWQEEISGLQASLTERDEKMTGLTAQVEDLTGKLATAEAERDEAVGRLGQIEQRLAELEHQAKLTEATARIAATAPEGQQFTDQALAIAATAEIDPTPEHTQALMAHLSENSGRMATVPVGEKPGLTATAPNGGETEEAWLAGKAIPEQTKDRVKVIAASSGIGLRAAYDKYQVETYGV